MEDENTPGNLEMRIVELENQLKELRAAQEAMSGGEAQVGAQAAMPCGYCGYCYCGYCYAVPCQQQMMGVQATSPCIPCTPGMGAQATAPCSIPCATGTGATALCSIPCVSGMGAQATSPCIPCTPGMAINPMLVCRVCSCIVECICGPCNVCSVCGGFGGGMGGGGGRFGGLGG